MDKKLLKLPMKLSAKPNAQPTLPVPQCRLRRIPMVSSSNAFTTPWLLKVIKLQVASLTAFKRTSQVRQNTHNLEHLTLMV